MLVDGGGGGGGGGVGEGEGNVGQGVGPVPLAQHDVVGEDDVVLHPGGQGVDLVVRGQLGEVARSAGAPDTCADTHVCDGGVNIYIWSDCSAAGAAHSDHKEGNVRSV